MCYSLIMKIQRLACLALSVLALCETALPVSADTQAEFLKTSTHMNDGVVSVKDAEIGDYVIINGEKFQLVASETVYGKEALDKLGLDILEARASYSLKNVRYLGDMPTAEIIASQQARPGLPLSLSVSQTRSATFSGSAGVSAEIFNASIGFNVATKNTITGSTSVPGGSVPYTYNGKKITLGALTAQCVYNMYVFDVYNGGTRVTSGSANNPVGCKFNYYLKTDDGMTLWP